MGFWTWRRHQYAGACTVGLSAATYPYGGEDVLKLIDQSDESRIVHVDPTFISFRCAWRPSKQLRTRLD
jgi:hypothetical protein